VELTPDNHQVWQTDGAAGIQKVVAENGQNLSIYFNHS